MRERSANPTKQSKPKGKHESLKGKSWVPRENSPQPTRNFGSGSAHVVRMLFSRSMPEAGMERSRGLEGGGGVVTRRENSLAKEAQQQQEGEEKQKKNCVALAI